MEFVESGGWHFTNVMSAEEMDYKMRNFLHHLEYEETLLWNDPSVNISWYETEESVSIKDQKGLPISEIDPLETSFDS